LAIVPSLKYPQDQRIKTQPLPPLIYSQPLQWRAPSDDQ
jgi:hypothetical protein